MPHSPAMIRVLRARENVALRDRWFADIIYNVRIEECEHTPTMDTNGISIRFNPHWVMEHDQDTNVEGVFCHEGWHVILNHVARQLGRQPTDWNIACDAIINPIVLRRGWTLPIPHVRIQEADDQRMSAERAYELIRQKRDEAHQKIVMAALKGEKNEGTNDTGNNGQRPDMDVDRNSSDPATAQGNKPPEGEAGPVDSSDIGRGVEPIDDGVPQPGSQDMREPTPEEMEAAKDFAARLDRAITLATERAVGNRSMDAEVLRNLKPEGPTQVLDWRDILREMAENNRNPDARTWSRPNRRYLGRGELRPGYLKDKINRLITGFDTSGSIVAHSEKVEEMKSEVANLLEEGIVSHVIVISADTAVRAEGEAQSSQEVIDFDLNIRGGGTNFKSAMDKIGQMEECVGCVFLTDMETSSFGEDPGFPVVWVNWGNPVKPGDRYYPPFGRVVDYYPRDKR